jgi:hypothetical protein
MKRSFTHPFKVTPEDKIYCALQNKKNRIEKHMSSGFAYQQQQYQQGPPQYAPQQYAPQQYGRMPQQQGMNMGMSQQQGMPDSGGNGPQGPLDKKVMVLYIIPGDQISMQAYQMVVDYPEILVQDARAINPRPAWLTRVPTVVMVTNKMVYDGAQAFQVLTGYIQNIRIMNGAQDQMVVNTVNPNEGFAVVDKTQHHKACADEQRMAAVPVGTAARTAMSVGQVNFTAEDDARYSTSEKGVSEAALNQYMAQREIRRQRPVQWRPSVLENGEFVSM